MNKHYLFAIDYIFVYSINSVCSFYKLSFYLDVYLGSSKKLKNNSKRFLKNPVFNFFEYFEENGIEKAKCLSPSCTFVSNNGRRTGNLITHLQRFHSDLFNKYNELKDDETVP